MSIPSSISLFWLILLLLGLGGCVGTPDLRPETQIQGERELQRGTCAYNNNDYRTAARQFSQALKLYRSVDDLDGIAQSSINLIETALAIGNYPAVEQRLLELTRLVEAANLHRYRARINLLRASLAFKQQNHADAIAALEPILPSFNDKQLLSQKLTDESMSALASRASIACEIDAADAPLWLERLDNALDEEFFRRRPALEGLLHRLRGKLQQSAGRETEALLQYELALDFYRKAGDRRGIATTLHSQARIHITQAAWNKTESLLQRALSIRLWLTDRSGTLAVVEDLIRLYQHTDQQAKLDEMEAWRGRLQTE
jgi:tetratricopeptide (TPR) repeat protein